MTSQIEEIIAVEVEDLDMLDDDKRHARCVACTPAKDGQAFIALCGRRAVMWPLPLGRKKHEPPKNACEDCVKLYWLPCRKCGWGR